jgi:protein arginine kinase activator
MICDICKKNLATVFSTRVINSVIKTFNLCVNCAYETDEEIAFEKLFQSLAYDILSLNDSENFSNTQTKEKIIYNCHKCGTNINQFRKDGKFGCPDCYSKFSSEVDMILKNTQYGEFHRGKFPVKYAEKTSDDSQIEKLKLNLQKAIQNEDFELAAKLRDKIRELTKKNK